VVGFWVAFVKHILPYIVSCSVTAFLAAPGVFRSRLAITSWYRTAFMGVELQVHGFGSAISQMVRKIRIRWWDQSQPAVDPQLDRLDFEGALCATRSRGNHCKDLPRICHPTTSWGQAVAFDSGPFAADNKKRKVQNIGALRLNLSESSATDQASRSRCKPFASPRSENKVLGQTSSSTGHLDGTSGVSFTVHPAFSPLSFSPGSDIEALARNVCHDEPHVGC